MRGLILLLFLGLCSSSSTAQSSSSQFVPGTYRSADGALLLTTGGNYVEPYFATKALITAQDAGLDVRQAGLAWIQWALQRQRKDGRFDRYCRKTGTDWKPCGAADADDSMLALWLQLLYRLAPDSGIPAEWQPSAQKAQSQLAKLRNGRLGIYHVSGRNHVALFMDNMEVYSALKDIGRAQTRFGDQAAKSTNKRAEDLAAAMDRVFWDNHNKWFRSSMQKNQPAFYPDVLAQVYPLIADFPLKNEDARSAWSAWRSRFASAWLEDRYDPHPWGLVALAAMKVGDQSSALCWLSHSEPLRYSTRWNILEEAVYQGLEEKLKARRSTYAAACSTTMDQGVTGQP